MKQQQQQQSQNPWRKQHLVLGNGKPQTIFYHCWDWEQE
jgi:hypothetical protein